MESGSETFRIEAFSDAVIAIAITLLVIEIRPPQGVESAAEMWAALAALWPNYLGYALSFAVIGIMWANHHTIFKIVQRTDHYLILLNLLFLFCLAFIPFPTALMAETLGHADERVGIVVYSGWFLVTALSYNVLWRYTAGRAASLMPDAHPDRVRGISRRFRLGPPAYALAFALAFVSTWASLGLILLLAVAYVLPYANPDR
jgi:uncharacterized membrane protein